MFVFVVVDRHTRPEKHTKHMTLLRKRKSKICHVGILQLLFKLWKFPFCRVIVDLPRQNGLIPETAILPTDQNSRIRKTVILLRWSISSK